MKIDIENAYYVKLGESGKWEESSIKEGKIRIGWGRQSLRDINGRKWNKIRNQLERYEKDKGVVTRDCNALKRFTESITNDIWTTFYQSHLWWCCLAKGKVRRDKLSKYRTIEGKWSNVDIQGNPLLIEFIPGSISKCQRFSGTICRVKEKDDLSRLINCEFSPEHNAIKYSRDHLVSDVERGLKRLHWKNFELLVDLIYRQSGWRRISFVGRTKKYSDIELKDSITGDLYQVQIKSESNEKEFKEYAKSFSGGKYRRLYFVVHSPDDKLLKAVTDEYPDVELIFGRRIAEMVVDQGLLNWLMSKIQ